MPEKTISFNLLHGDKDYGQQKLSRTSKECFFVPDEQFSSVDYEVACSCSLSVSVCVKPSHIF